MATAVETPRTAPRSGRMTEEDLLSALPARSANREVRVGLFVLVGLVAFFAALFTFTDVGTFRGRYYAAHGGAGRGRDAPRRPGADARREHRPRGGLRHGARRAWTCSWSSTTSTGCRGDSHVVLKSNGLLGGMVVDVVPGNSGRALRGRRAHPRRSPQAGLMSAAGDARHPAPTACSPAPTRSSPGRPSARWARAPSSSRRSSPSSTTLAAAAAARARRALRQPAPLRARAWSAPPPAPELQRSRPARRLAHRAPRRDHRQPLGDASSSLEPVLGRMERGEGTLGKLTPDDALYVNLNGAVGQPQPARSPTSARTRRST